MHSLGCAVYASKTRKAKCSGRGENCQWNVTDLAGSLVTSCRPPLQSIYLVHEIFAVILTYCVVMMLGSFAFIMMSLICTRICCMVSRCSAGLHTNTHSNGRLNTQHKAKGTGSPYSIAHLILVLGSQPAGDVSHKPGGKLPLLSTRPAITSTTLKRAATNFAAW